MGGLSRFEMVCSKESSDLWKRLMINFSTWRLPTKSFLDKTDEIQFSYSWACVVSGVYIYRFQVHTPRFFTWKVQTQQRTLSTLYGEKANPAGKWQFKQDPWLDDYFSIEPSQFCLWTYMYYIYKWRSIPIFVGKTWQIKLNPDVC